MSIPSRRKPRFDLRIFLVWHRHMGVAAALFTLVIAGTGILLNHTEGFGFDTTYVQSEWILDWYGIDAPDQLRSYPVGEHRVALMGDHLYLDRQRIDGDYRDLTGATQIGDMLVISVHQSILLLTQDGELIERLGRADGVPTDIDAVGLHADGQLLVRVAHEIYVPDADFMHWRRHDADHTDVHWATPAPLNTESKKRLQSRFRSEVLPMERLLLDMHSGRLFGRIGPWLFDMAALLLMLLSLTGAWIWLKSRR